MSTSVSYTLLNKVSVTTHYSLLNKMLSYRRETDLQGGLVMAQNGTLELGDNTLRTL